MSGRKVWTRKVTVAFDGKQRTLGDILIPEDEVPDEFFIRESQLPQWEYLKGPKREERTAANGHVYHYSEGGIPFPDRTDIASRTILTGRGGTSPSRFKHIVKCDDGRYRRLTPVELERLNGFDDGWTEGMPDGRRAFMMGNALVVGVVAEIGRRVSGTEEHAMVPLLHGVRFRTSGPYRRQATDYLARPHAESAVSSFDQEMVSRSSRVVSGLSR